MIRGAAFADIHRVEVADNGGIHPRRTFAMILFAGFLAVIFGLYAAISPSRAVRWWGRRDLYRLPRSRQVLYLRWYRAFGVILCLGGVLFTLDNVLFSNDYRRPAEQPPVVRTVYK
jgi:hypothetical protein